MDVTWTSRRPHTDLKGQVASSVFEQGSGNTQEIVFLARRVHFPDFGIIGAGILGRMAHQIRTYHRGLRFARMLAAILAAVFALGMCACFGPADGPGASTRSQTASPSVSEASAAQESSTSASQASEYQVIDEDGWYTSKDEVALYIHEYGRLPGNYLTKSEARKAGWVPSKGNLAKVCPGMSIGGDTFYNDEGELPDARGRSYRECDIDYVSGKRGAKRIVFSNDGLIFYTDDHYRTFEQLY